MPILFNEKGDSDNLIKWITISVILTTLFWVVGNRTSDYIIKKYPINRQPIKHVVAILAFFTVLSLTTIFIIFLINFFFGASSENYWKNRNGIHVIIFLITFFMITLHEGIYLFFRWKESLVTSERLEKENAIANYQSLINQVNPHFLFNSLGTLSSLIASNSENAIKYVDQLSRTYRYILDVGDRDIVLVKEELEFIDSFIYLLQIRFENNLKIDLLLTEETTNKRILPLSLQLLVENVIKHNEISDQNPITIHIIEELDYLVVINKIQPKNIESNSKPIGLTNLANRYRFFNRKEPLFINENGNFIAKIPFI